MPSNSLRSSGILPSRTLGTVLAALLISLWPTFPAGGGRNSALAGERLVLAGDNWCPYTCLPDSPAPGFLTEITQAALEARGHAVEYTARPWNRAIREAQAGRLDGLVGALAIEVPDFVLPDCGLGSTRTVFYVRAGDPWRYTGPESLRGKRVGIVEGYLYGEPLDSDIREHPENFIKSRGEDAASVNLQSLALGRIDVAMEDRLAAEHLTRAAGREGSIQAAGEPLEPLAVTVAFSPVSPRSREYAADLCAGLQDLKHSGKLKEIIQRYGLARWP